MKFIHFGLLATISTGLILSASSIFAQRLAGERSLSTTKYGYTIVRNITRAGKHAQRFEVRAGDCGKNSGWSDCDSDRERSEISIGNRWHYGENKWIGFSIYLPADFTTSTKVKTTVGQIHTKGGPAGKAGGYRSLPPLMQMEMKRNAYRLCVHILSGPSSNVNDKCRYFHLAKISQMRGRWTDIRIHFDTSKGKELLEVFLDGRKVATISGWITFRPKEYYFKYGIYRSFVSRNRGPMPTQILYIDEVRMGNSAAKVRINEAQPVD